MNDFDKLRSSSRSKHALSNRLRRSMVALASFRHSTSADVHTQSIRGGKLDINFYSQDL